MAAALRLAHKTRRLPAAITLVNGSAMFVERIRLHQAAADEHVRQRPIPDLLGRGQVRFVCGWAAALSPQTRQVTVQTAQGVETLAYDYLLYTLGSTTDKDSIRGVREHALAVGNPADSIALRQRLRLLAAGESVIVVGGGLTGIETAAEIAERYPALRVQLITAGRVGDALSVRGRAHIQSAFTRLGVGVQEGVRIDYVTAHAAIAADGRAVPFALCVWAGPLQALPLAREAGLAVNRRGQILIDNTMRSITAPAIYAAGDAAAFVPEAGVTTRMACATALPMGAHAADNLAAQLLGAEQQPFRFGYVAQCISLGRRDGLLQFVQADDSAQDRIVTGKPAAWIKEAICRAAGLAATTGWAARAYQWRKWRRQPERTNSLRPAPVDASRIKAQR
jgi:NADH dehydrogenase FAD-containing subunit